MFVLLFFSFLLLFLFSICFGIINRHWVRLTIYIYPPSRVLTKRIVPTAIVLSIIEGEVAFFFLFSFYNICLVAVVVFLVWMRIVSLLKERFTRFCLMISLWMKCLDVSSRTPLWEKRGLSVTMVPFTRNWNHSNKSKTSQCGCHGYSPSRAWWRQCGWSGWRCPIGSLAVGTWVRLWSL